jgi:hypothetical protein
MSIMEMPRPNDPHIMGFRLPMRSRKNVGYSDPMKNLGTLVGVPWGYNNRRLKYRIFQCEADSEPLALCATGLCSH